MQHLIIGLFIGGAICTIEQSNRQTEMLLNGDPIDDGTQWVTSEAYNRAGEFLSECESLTGCFSS